MDNAWRAFIDHRGNFFLYALLPAIVVTFAYVTGALACIAIESMPSLRQYKLQPKVHPRAAWRECMRHVFFHKLTSEIPLTFAGFPIFVALGVSATAPLPSVATVVLTLVASFVIEDAWHYFAHRTLHTRWAYKKIHFIHHKYTTPFGPAANYAHPAETVFTGFGTLLAVIVIRPHLFTVLVWIVVRQWQAMSVHVGYDFPWRPSRFIPLVGGARFHDRHHRHFKSNYAPTFVWLDRLLGTADEKALGVPEAPRPLSVARTVTEQE